MTSLAALMEALSFATDKVKAVEVEITAAEADDTTSEELATKLENARKDQSATKESLLELLMAQHKETKNTVGEISGGPGESELDSNRQPIATRTRGETTLISARLSAPKEYKYGNNFTNWCSRFKQYVETCRLRKEDAYGLLLNNVDDRTLDKLESAAERLTPKQKRDPDLFIPIFELTMYPRSEIRALRQQLTSGQLAQDSDEDIDTFASRIRSLAKRAYSEPVIREEQCLSAFLNGMKDEKLYDKVIAVQGAEDDFNLAVESAIKFEKLRRSRSTHGRTAEQLDVLRVAGSQHNPVSADQARDNRGMHYSGGGRSGQNDTYRNRDNGYNNYSRSHSRGRYSPNDGDNRRRNRPNNGLCYRCDLPGHIAAFCPSRPNALNANRVGSSDQTTGPRQTQQ